jgi:uncharacterized protein YdhG (YjbR/CyaY superfamily)
MPASHPAGRRCYKTIMKITTMDEFLKHRVLPEHLPIIALLRKMMRECAPEAKEQISYGILMWKQTRGLAVVSPTKKDITFAFSQGAKFEDKYELLQGVGKVSKHVKIKNLKETPIVAIKYYIKQAVQLDAR